MTTMQLLVSFEDQSPSFVHGFEAGTIWEKLRHSKVYSIEMTVHDENVETIRRMAVAEGWDAEFTPSEVEGWTYLRLERSTKNTDLPNPNGLSVVK